MDKRITIAIGFALMASSAVSAQSNTHFLDSLRHIENGKGRVEVVESPEIDKLVNGTVTTPPPRTTTPTVSNKAVSDSKTSASPANTERQTNERPNNDRTAVKNNKAEDNSSEFTEPVIDTRKKVIAKAYKATGYRIQVFSGGNSRTDRQKAQDAGNQMKSAFPTEPIYVHFYSPSWKCRMGNYRDLGEARRILKQVKALGYSQACIVKGKISVSY